MNIDAESIALLSLILRDAPQNNQLVLCVLARSNQAPAPIKFHSNTEYPTFYGYANERMTFYLMNKGIITNVPRPRFTNNIISAKYLAYAEAVINKHSKWDLSQKLELVSKFITLSNKTIYKDAGVYLVFQDKAQDFIKDYMEQNKDKISPFLESKLGRFAFGNTLLSNDTQDNNSALKKRYEALLGEIKSPKIERTETTPTHSNLDLKSFKLTDTVLTVNKTEVRFRKGTKTLALLRLLVKKPKGFYYSEEADKLEGASADTTDIRNTYYEVCRGISNRLAKVGITDFLKFDFNEVKINPDYQKPLK